jgi:hypothetical protein
MHDIFIFSLVPLGSSFVFHFCAVVPNNTAPLISGNKQQMHVLCKVLAAGSVFRLQLLTHAR